MVMWNPWRGCQKISEGCRYCYIHKGDYKKGIDTNQIVQTKDFDKPIKKYKNGQYQMKSGIVYTTFSSDFLISQADNWRKQAWAMMKERKDCTFLFLTKRIQRLPQCLPEDWDDGYDNVVIGCTIENQNNADRKLALFKELPIKHKYIIAQPLIEAINIEQYLTDIEMVVVGGESDYQGRPLNYDWVLSLREQCIKHQVSFEFRQCATNFIKDDKKYKIPTKLLSKQATLANINYYVKNRKN